MTCTMTDTIYKMNIYFCHDRSSDCGCFVAAETIGKAKALYAQYDGMESFVDYRANIAHKSADIPAGVYDDDCPELARLGLKYYYSEE